jgi:transcriptional regulator with XRE-family HTH domain
VKSIKACRQALNVSLSEMARRTKLHREQVARAERDGIDVRASTLVILARALGVPVCELFGKEGEHAGPRRRGRRRK